jgi:hypothetical protein
VDEQVVVLISISIVVVAALGVLWMAMTSRRAVREMEHRERLAMIQRGLVPAPESDPLGFESAIAPFEGGSLRGERWQTAGTLTIGLGLAFTVLLTFTAESSEVGLGIGGAFIVLGGAILLNGYQLSRSRRAPPRPLAARRQYHDGPFPPMDPPSTAP